MSVMTLRNSAPPDAFPQKWLQLGTEADLPRQHITLIYSIGSRDTGSEILQSHLCSHRISIFILPKGIIGVLFMGSYTQLIR